MLEVTKIGRVKSDIFGQTAKFGQTYFRFIVQFLK